MIIKLVRHGESLQQTGDVNATEIGDAHVTLSDKGMEQAISLGQGLGPVFLTKCLIYTSPYIRCRQTIAGVINGSGALTHPDFDPRIFEDPRLREMEFGYDKSRSDIQREKGKRETHGWFYYQMNGGESPANVYDRVSSFIESMMRQVQRKRVPRILIASHGITIRCFVMRFLHLSVSDYDRLDNPENCDVVTISSKLMMPNPQFTNSKWGVCGLRFRE